MFSQPVEKKVLDWKCKLKKDHQSKINKVHTQTEIFKHVHLLTT